MAVLIAGGSGLIGSALRAHLEHQGEDVRVLVRRPARAHSEVRWDPASDTLPVAAFSGVRAVINLAGAPVAQRWNEKGRSDILASRVRATSTIAHAIARLPDTVSPPTLVQGSAVGFYGDRGEVLVTEDDLQGDGFLADVVRQWEEAAEPARRAGARVVSARTGIVLAPHGGALARLLPLVKLGLAGPLGSGSQWWSWISLRDEVRALSFLASSQLSGPVNLVSPTPARCRDVVTALAKAAHRPAIVRVPGWALRLAIGGFAGEILASQRVAPSRLIQVGFEFRDAQLAPTAQRLMEKR